MDKTIIWQGKPKLWFGLPSFTKYILYKDRLTVKTGLLNTKEEEIRLYRVMDMELIISFEERLLSVGSIKLISTDKTLPELIIRRVENVREVKDIISDLIDKNKKINKIVEVE